MYLREEPTLTLGELDSKLNSGASGWEGETAALEVDVVSDDPVLKIPHVAEIPLGEEGQSLLAGYVGVPQNFFSKVKDPEVRQSLLEWGISSKGTPQEAVIAFFPGVGIVSVENPKKLLIRPRDLTGRLLDVFPEDSTVVDYHDDGEFLMLDVLYGGKGNDLYAGGDVGDITRAGIRVVQNRKAQAKPEISRYLYRLACTNGMERKSEELKITVRGNDRDQVIESFGLFAQAALEGLREWIDEFYALKHRPVQDPALMLRSVAGEYRLSDKLYRRMVGDAAVEGVETEFDLVNLITNQANHEDFLDKPSQRRKLEAVGGSLSSAQRWCNSCYGIV